MASIQDVWTSGDESIWLAQIATYWERVGGQKKKALEEELDSLKIQSVRDFTNEEWRDFLAIKYIPWKHSPGPFWASIQKKFIAKYESAESLNRLSANKRRIFGSSPEMIIDLLRTVDEIYQFGIPSASGLLSLLFPLHFGTVDRFAMESLQRIEEFKNDLAIQRIDSKNIRLGDAVRAISIMRAKALENNRIFKTNYWTSRRIDMVLWSTRESGNRHRVAGTREKVGKENTATKPAAWEIVDQVARSMSDRDPDRLVRARIFSEEMRRKGYKGAQASDYVHGMKNKDPRSGIHPVFEKVRRGIYRYVGKDWL